MCASLREGSAFAGSLLMQSRQRRSAFEVKREDLPQTAHRAMIARRSFQFQYKLWRLDLHTIHFSITFGQFSSAILIFPGMSSLHIFWTFSFRFRYNFPSTIDHWSGSISAVDPRLTAYAQYPPYCGAYPSGFWMKSDLWSLFEKSHFAPFQ